MVSVYLGVVCNTLGVWSRSPRHLGGSDPLVCEGPSAHGVERGAPPAAPGVLCGGALGGQSTQADPLHGPGPPPAHARTSGLGGRGENPVELSLYPMVTRAAL